MGRLKEKAEELFEKICSNANQERSVEEQLFSIQFAVRFYGCVLIVMMTILLVLFWTYRDAEIEFMEKRSEQMNELIEIYQNRRKTPGFSYGDIRRSFRKISSCIR